MDITNIISFLIVAAVLVVSPGPNGLLILRTISINSKKAGFANILGFVVAFGLHGSLAIFGISIILVNSAQAFWIFKMLGAAYLIWIGIKSLLNASRPIAHITDDKNNRVNSNISLTSSFCEGLITNVLNPKVSMFYLAAFPQFVDVNENVFEAFSLVTMHALVNVIWFSLLIMTLSKFKNIANGARFKQRMNAFSGIIFIGFGAKLALLRA